MLFGLSFLTKLLFSLQTTFELGYLLYDREDFLMRFTDFFMLTLLLYIYQRYAFHLPKMRILLLIIGFIVLDGGLHLIALFLIPAQLHIPLLMIASDVVICIILLAIYFRLTYQHYHQFLNQKK